MDNQNTYKATKAFKILKTVFIILPLAAGIDKFTNLLTNWSQYLNPMVTDMLPISAPNFMKIAGVIEIIAAIIVITKPKLGGYLISAWLAMIALSLIAGAMYLDIAVRDIVISLAALSMAKLAPKN